MVSSHIFFARDVDLESVGLQVEIPASDPAITVSYPVHPVPYGPI